MLQSHGVILKRRVAVRDRWIPRISCFSEQAEIGKPKSPNNLGTRRKVVVLARSADPGVHHKEREHRHVEDAGGQE